MKKDTSVNLKVVYDKLSFIEKNYDQAIAIEELENVACYSYPCFSV